MRPSGTWAWNAEQDLRDHPFLGSPDLFDLRLYSLVRLYTLVPGRDECSAPYQKQRDLTTGDLKFARSAYNLIADAQAWRHDAFACVTHSGDHSRHSDTPGSTVH